MLNIFSGLNNLSHISGLTQCGPNPQTWKDSLYIETGSWCFSNRTSAASMLTNTCKHLNGFPVLNGFKLYNSNVNRQNTLSCLDQNTCRRLRLWNSRDHEAVCVCKQRMESVLHLWSKFGDPGLNGPQVILQTNPGLTHGRTDGHMQAMAILSGQNWPGVKIIATVETSILLTSSSPSCISNGHWKLIYSSFEMTGSNGAPSIQEVALTHWLPHQR